MKKSYLAFDLGAESGRAVLGEYDGSKLAIRELHRFPNGPVVILGQVHWDVLHLFKELKVGLSLAARESHRQLAGVSCDTWGVDFGLLGKDNTLLGSPYHYRDSRTDGMMEEAFQRVGREEIFQRTGIQFMKINTLYQLLSLVVSKSPLLKISECLLMMADLFHFFLTGRKVAEFTLATTSQAYDPREGSWSRPLLEKLDIPVHIMPEVVAPGTVIGDLLPEISRETNLPSLPVIASASHDTASAVAAVPARGNNWAFLSSGTWSLLGVEVPRPIINEKALRYNFTNEGGVKETFRLLKNLSGLWLVQECRRIWEKEGKPLSYDELTRMAVQARPFQVLIDPDDEVFLKPADMPAEILKFCRRTNQPLPGDRGSIIRSILESLALKYRLILEQLRELSGRRLETLHIIGGGTQNRLLCQWTADAAGIPVIAGPIEATAIGNILMQAMARGDLSSLSEGREIVYRSFPLVTYQPQNTAVWEENYPRFQKIVSADYSIL